MINYAIQTVVTGTKLPMELEMFLLRGPEFSAPPNFSGDVAKKFRGGPQIYNLQTTT